MKILLQELHKIQCIEDNTPLPAKEGYRKLRVLYCAICRTDAKMWAKGHRDLSLPRVLGHEISAVDEATGQYYTVWPGQSCNECEYCKSGRENLCDHMKIIGFHSDGGFSHYISVPENSLIPLTPVGDKRVGCFAEPAACVFNALDYCGPVNNRNIIIFGGGVVGILAALAFRKNGANVTVIEKNEEKIAKTQFLFADKNIQVCKQTNKSNFDIAVNCCDCPIAFSEAVLKLKKTGKLLYFSGIQKNNEIDTNILNLIHYKELDVHGSYGPVKKNMFDAVSFCDSEGSSILHLIEETIEPQNIEGIMNSVLQGASLKYIIDFTKDCNFIKHPEDKTNSTKSQLLSLSCSSPLKCKIYPSNKNLENKAKKKIDGKTKPLRALGKLEDIAVQMCCIQNKLDPAISTKNVLVFAGDHGVVEEGVSAFPAKVTKQMVLNFLRDGAAINAFCSHYNIDLKIIDVGVAAEFEKHQHLFSKKVGFGTKNFTLQKAMSLKETLQSIEAGKESFLQISSDDVCDIVGIGEMGIGNTTSATAIIAAITGLPVSELIGRGTGVDNEGKKRKLECIDKALMLHKPKSNDPLDILSKVGGYEIAGMCGAIFMAAEKNTAVVLDGLISTAAGLLCYLFEPAVADYMIAGHKSVEKGQLAALEYMSLKPVIDLDLRLGEGTGAAMSINIVELACKIMRDMATFEEARIDTSWTYE